MDDGPGRSISHGNEAPLSKKIANYAIMTALMVVMTLLAFPVPPPIQFIGFAPILVYLIGIMLKPLRALSISAVGSVLGQLCYDLITGNTDPLTMLVYATGAFVARGLGAFIISLFETSIVRKRNIKRIHSVPVELLILIVGAIWEYIGYSLVGAPYWISLTPGLTVGAVFIGYLYVLFDLVFVPVGYAVVEGVRRGLDVQYLDAMMFSDYQ